MNRKKTEKKAHLIVQQLKHNGVCFPVSLTHIIPMLPENPVYVIRELAQKGYLANPELYEGPLPVGTAQRLEKIGVLDRATFREMLENGRINLETINYVGRKRQEAILRWAQLKPEEIDKCAIRLKLPVRVVRQLSEFVLSPEYHSMHDVVRSVVDSVLVATKIRPPVITKSAFDPMQTDRAP
jgi:hypothetical protein